MILMLISIIEIKIWSVEIQCMSMFRWINAAVNRKKLINIVLKLAENKCQRALRGYIAATIGQVFQSHSGVW